MAPKRHTRPLHGRDFVCFISTITPHAPKCHTWIFPFLTAHTSDQNLLHLWERFTSSASFSVKAHRCIPPSLQSINYFVASINKLWWHINILYVLIFVCLWLISLSAALDAEEEDRGGAWWCWGRGLMVIFTLIGSTGRGGRSMQISSVIVSRREKNLNRLEGRSLK